MLNFAAMLNRENNLTMLALTSPRPSPLPPRERRGRSVSSFSAEQQLASARRVFKFLNAANGCFLSQQERVRVRENAALTFKAQNNFPHAIFLN